MVKLLFEPRVTVLSTQHFQAPDHLPAGFLGDSTPPERLAEYGGRVCYMSQANPAGKTTAAYLQHIVDVGHESVLEHAFTVYLLEGVSRSLTHELVRHRVGTSISQLSQRYVDATDTAFVVPPAIQQEPALLEQFAESCARAVEQYESLTTHLMAKYAGLGGTMAKKRAREAARSVLPNATETKVVWGCNLRALRHILHLRANAAADMEIQRFAMALYRASLPVYPQGLGDVTVLADGTLQVPRA